MPLLRALMLSVAQLSDPAFLAVMVRSLIVTILIFAAFGIGLAYLLDGADPCALLNDTCPLSDTASRFGAVLFLVLGSWLLFPPIAIGVMSAYMERVVAAVERRHYPQVQATASPSGMASTAALGVRSSLRVLVYNLLALPFYILLLVTGVGTIALFVVVNGLAIGRDLGEMVANRHLHRVEARQWLSDTRGDRALLGMAVTGLFMVPVVNLLAPILAAAMATHIFHARRPIET